MLPEPPLPAHERIMQYLRAHPDQWHRPVDVAAELGIKPVTVRSALTRLAKRGEIRASGHGHYAFETET